MTGLNIPVLKYNHKLKKKKKKAEKVKLTFMIHGEKCH